MVSAGGVDDSNVRLREVIAHKFQEYREENDRILMWTKRVLRIADDIENYGKDKVTDEDVLSKKSKLNNNDEYKEIFNALAKDLNEIKRLIGELKESVGSETDAIKEFLGKTSYEDVKTNVFLLSRIKTFNENKYNVVASLLKYVPSLDKDLLGLVRVPEVRLGNAVTLFVDIFKDFMKSFDNSKDKGSIFFTLAKILKYLVTYSEDFNSIYSDNKSNFLDSIRTIDKGSAKFAEQFFSGNYGFNRVKRLNEILAKYDMNLASLESGSTYEALGDDKDREAIDKFVLETLLVLLKGKTAQINKLKIFYDSDSEKKEEKKSDFDVDKALLNVRSRFAAFITIAGPEIGSPDNFKSMTLSDPVLQSSKQSFRGFFDALLGSDKSKIIEKDGKYSCENFEKILENVDKFYNKQACSEFLKFCLDNFDNLYSGNYDDNLISSFFRNLSAVTQIIGFK